MGLYCAASLSGFVGLCGVSAVLGQEGPHLVVFLREQAVDLARLAQEFKCAAPKACHDGIAPAPGMACMHMRPQLSANSRTIAGLVSSCCVTAVFKQSQFKSRCCMTK